MHQFTTIKCYALTRGSSNAHSKPNFVDLANEKFECRTAGRIDVAQCAKVDDNTFERHWIVFLNTNETSSAIVYIYFSFNLNVNPLTLWFGLLIVLANRRISLGKLS